ncbi:MAG TPA: hypothetical protein DCS43_06555 [Verrucomicrobia bacterium]|nr:hypothetical protein [Verrucomicrobiota bacterium]
MKAPLQLTILLPEAAIPPRAILAIDVPAADGRLCVMAHHQASIIALTAGQVTITTLDGEREAWQISAGALRVEHNTAILLTPQCQRIDKSTS